jgi:hypothetical protein
MNGSEDKLGHSSKQSATDEATKELSSEEKIAVAALKKYNPAAKNVNVWSTIPRCLGGSLVLIEFDDPDENEWCVLVRRGRAVVYQDWEDVLKLIPDYRPSFVEQISYPQVVIAILTFVILTAAVIAFWQSGEVKEPFRAALASVIGFWLGRAAPDHRA